MPPRTPQGRAGGAHRDADDVAAEDAAVTAVLTASRVLVAVSARSLAGVEDRVTLSQFRMLVVLARQREINQTGLAAALQVSPSTAMRMLDRLVPAGLATRRENPDNRREVLIGLTPAGRRMVGGVTRRRRREIARLVGRLDDEQRAALVTALDALADAAGEPRVPADGPASLDL